MAEFALTWFTSPRIHSPSIKGARKSCVRLPRTSEVIRSQNQRSPSTRFSGGRAAQIEPIIEPDFHGVLVVASVAQREKRGRRDEVDFAEIVKLIFDLG